METNNIQKVFRFSNAKFLDMIRLMLLNIEIDKQAIIDYGVSLADILHFKELESQFAMLVQHPTIDIDAADASKDKMKLYKVVLNKTLDISRRVLLRYGRRSAEYKSLEFANIYHLREDEFITRVRMIHELVSEKLSDYSSVGITAAMLEDFASQIQALESARINLINSVETRKAHKLQIIAKGNELYAAFRRFAIIGKAIYAQGPPKDYYRYVIYPTKHSAKKKLLNDDTNDIPIDAK